MELLAAQVQSLTERLDVKQPTAANNPTTSTIASAMPSYTASMLSSEYHHSVSTESGGPMAGYCDGTNVHIEVITEEIVSLYHAMPCRGHAYYCESTNYSTNR